MPSTIAQPDRRHVTDHVERITLPTRLLAAVLCLGVAAVHVIDQAGLPGTKDPGYVQGLYYALELGGILTAIALLIPRFPVRWLFPVLIAAGPIVGYVLSRGPGLPGYSDDIGNWAEPLGIVSVVIELALLGVSLRLLGVSRRESAPGRLQAAQR
jgi:hypothetical protein